MSSPTGDRTRFLRRLRDLVRRARERVETLAELRAVRERRGEIDGLVDDLERQLGRVRRSAVITLVGATGAGKSTLLNALVGAEIATAGESRPTTRRPVVYAPADAELEDLLGGLPGDAPEVVRYDPASSHGPWTEQVLIDAPDINSVADEHREVVAALADRSDALVAVLHRQSVAEDASVRFLDPFAGRRHVVFALNRADELTDESRAELLEEVRRLARERWDLPHAPALAISARDARTQPGSPGWAELCRALSELVQRGALGAVRRHNALGTARAIAELFEEVAADVGPELERLPVLVEEGMAALAAFTESEVALRLRLRRPDLAALYCTELAKRWDGPGGWTLRSGGLGTLGMGAGALLARRNPLLAAGAAVGGMAAGRARESGRRRSLSDAADLLPTRSELEARHTATLGEARLCAARLVGDPTAFGVPDAELARERVAAAVEEPWEELLLRSLPERAQANAAAWLRWPVDLPVYALAGWVVFRAGDGFLAGEYLGMDFLINALLILAAYLFVVRFLLRRAFGLGAARLSKTVATRLREALVRLGGAARDEVTDRTARARAALGDLRALDATFRAELSRGEPDA